MQNASVLARKLNSYPWLPEVLSLAGVFVYLLQAIEIARTRTSFLDEGMYLYKGWLFLSGLQVPYADYGVQTNHSILSYLIPGASQMWFGRGLDTGRYFMIL